MKMIEIADLTIRESAEKAEFTMSFKEKMEVAKQLEKRKVANYPTEPALWLLPVLHVHC